MIIVIVLLALLHAASATAELALNIRTDASEYVVRQPWSLTFVLSNTGDSLTNVLPAKELGQNMEFMELELTTPDGVVERRHNQFVFTLREIDPDWEGEVLPVGGQIVRTIYPYTTRVRGATGCNPTDWTFSKPGTYRLRLVYAPPPNLRIIHKASGGELLSNEIIIRINEGDKVGEEILDVYWCQGEEITWGETTHRFDVDPEPLRAILIEYPNHPLSPYIKLNLARALLTLSIAGADAGAVDEANALLDELQDFSLRKRELVFHKSSVYALKNQIDKVADLFVAAVEDDPLLLDDIHFVGAWMLRTTDDTQTAIDRLGRYEAARRAGRLREFEALGVERILIPPRGKR
jgi:hypothetical protein